MPETKTKKEKNHKIINKLMNDKQGHSLTFFPLKILITFRRYA